MRRPGRPARTRGYTMIATSYPFFEVFWTMLIFFFFIVWLWILFTVFADVFRRHDIGGFAKTKGQEASRRNH
jgi:hypothetical protein